ncbi:MAG: restriction endonuclease subunit S [Curvibacter sp.]|nr:MAG: restriction endonuclease subunit S [Curvibacter sp.]
MLLSNLNLLATASGGVTRLRELILTLAVQGKLVPQDPKDEPASELLKKIRVEKDRLIAEGKIKRDKPQAEIAEEEKPFELPQGWEWVRLPEVTYNLGQGAPTEKFTYIDVASIDNERGLVADTADTVEPVDAPSRARKNVAVGTVLYSTIRPYLKNIAVVEKDYAYRAIASTAFAIMHPHIGLHSKYLLHYLRSAIFTDFVSSKAVGVAYPAINDANFFEGVIAIPPTKEQSRIVTRVEELMRLCDVLEAKGQLEATQHAQLVSTLLATLTDSETPAQLANNWHRIATHFDLLLDRPEALDALEQTILQLAVRGLLIPQDPQDEPASALLKKIRAEKDKLIAEGKIKRDKPLPPIAEDEKPFELPQGWEWAQASETCDSSSLITYGILKPVWVQSGVPTVRVQDMKGGTLNTTALGQCSLERAEKFDKTKLVAGDLLIAKDGATLGKTAFVPPELAGANITQHVLRFPIHTALNREYVRMVIDSEHGQSWMLSETKGVALPGVNVGDFRRLPMPFPPLAEQSRIVTRVAHLRRLCADLRQRLAEAQSTQSRLAESLVAEVA